jgi:hypothetical protein
MLERGGRHYMPSSPLTSIGGAIVLVHQKVPHRLRIEVKGNFYTTHTP